MSVRYGAPIVRDCELCSKRAALLDVSVNGVAAYRCLNGHVSLVDVRKSAAASDGPVHIPPSQRVLE
jgi:hypothetical protein